jgi:hypothetical protein
MLKRFLCSFSRSTQNCLRSPITVDFPAADSTPLTVATKTSAGYLERIDRDQFQRCFGKSVGLL